jgi:type VI secretion system FHA domain protein
LLGLDEPRTPPPSPAPRARDLNQISAIHEPIVTPQVHEREPFIPDDALDVSEVAEPDMGSGIPSDYDPLAPETRSAAQARRPSPTPRPRAETPAPQPVQQRTSPIPPTPRPPVDAGASSEFDFAAFMEGAGLAGVTPSPELARDFGRIMRLVIAGLLETLRARQQIKSQFRMPTTAFKPKENNPLKFSANVEDALHNLLVKHNSAFLGPVAAFEDAFRDVRNHQMAMLAGMDTAYKAMLAEFDPQQLQEQFDRQLKKGAILGAPARMRYWDLYGERFRDRVRDPDACFRQLFGDEFAKSYEEQLEQLRTLDRTKPK